MVDVWTATAWAGWLGLNEFYLEWPGGQQSVDEVNEWRQTISNREKAKIEPNNERTVGRMSAEA